MKFEKFLDRLNEFGKTGIALNLNKMAEKKEDDPFEKKESVLLKTIAYTNPVEPINERLIPSKFQQDLYSRVLESQTEIIFGNIPSKSNCYRIITFKSKDPNKKSHASLAKTPELKHYENNFAIQCKVYRNLNLDVDFTLELKVYYPSRRADLDNSLKVLLDCLQTAKAIKNDNKCTKIIAERFVDVNNPRVEFVIKPSNQ